MSLLIYFVLVNEVAYLLHFQIKLYCVQINFLLFQYQIFFFSIFLTFTFKYLMRYFQSAILLFQAFERFFTKSPLISAAINSQDLSHF